MRPGCAVSLVAAWVAAAAALAVRPGRADAQAMPASDAATAAAAADQRVIAAIRAHDLIMDDLTYLSDVIGPRLTGSPSLERATQWAVDRMKTCGLTNVHTEPWTLSIGWERGTITARLVDPPNTIPLHMESAAWSVGTHGAITAPVVLFDPQSVEDISSFQGKLNGAIVLVGAPKAVAPITPEQPGETSLDRLLGLTPGAAASPAAAPAPGPTPEQRRQIQAASFQLLQAEKPAAVLLDAGKPYGLFTMFGSPDERFGRSDTVPLLFVAHEHYALLARLAARTDGTAVRLSLNVPSHFKRGAVTVYNVVGDLPGVTKPDEIVVLGGHLDSWDLGEGTTDNGTGTCVTLEAARALVASGVRPARTMRFILFTGEEEGEFGSEAYVKAHQAEMPKTSGALIDDAGTGRFLAIHTEGYTKIGPVLQAAAAPSLSDLGFTVKTGHAIPGGASAGSDHDPFNEVGVPGLFFDQQADGYFYSHHSQADTLDKADPPALEQDAEVMAILGLRIADLPDLLPRDHDQSGTSSLQ